MALKSDYLGCCPLDPFKVTALLVNLSALLWWWLRQGLVKSRCPRQHWGLGVFNAAC